MDVVRRQIVAIDQIVGRSAYSLIGRDSSERPTGPPNLEAATGVDEEGHGQMTGHYAGPISRLAAYVIDAVILWASYLLTLMGFTFVVDFVLSIEMNTGWETGTIGVLLGALWGFTYYFVSWALAGRTIGMGIIGITVFKGDGTAVSSRSAFIRPLVFPISFIIFGLGFLGIFISPTRRALHDAAAGTVVVYDWGSRPAEMNAPITQWVNRHMAEED